MEIKMNLQKAACKTIKLNLSKAGIEEKNIPLMAVFQSIDCSGSMGNLFSSNWVSELLVVAAGAALTFDDNKSLQVSFFSHVLRDNVPEITEDTDITSYIRNNKVSAYGGTDFSLPLHWFNNTDASGYDEQVIETHTEQVESKSIFKRLFGIKDTKIVKESVSNGAESAPEDLPKLLIMITDGACESNIVEKHTLNELNSFGKHDFLFTIGLGSGFDEKFAKKISSSSNSTYFWVQDPKAITSDVLLEQFTNDKKFVDFVKAHSKS